MLKEAHSNSIKAYPMRAVRVAAFGACLLLLFVSSVGAQVRKLNFDPNKDYGISQYGIHIDQFRDCEQIHIADELKDYRSGSAMLLAQGCYTDSTHTKKIAVVTFYNTIIDSNDEVFHIKEPLLFIYSEGDPTQPDKRYNERWMLVNKGALRDAKFSKDWEMVRGKFSIFFFIARYGKSTFNNLIDQGKNVYGSGYY